VWLVELHARWEATSQVDDTMPDMDKLLKACKLWTDMLQKLTKLLFFVQDAQFSKLRFCITTKYF